MAAQKTVKQPDMAASSEMEHRGAAEKLQQLQVHGLQDILNAKSLKAKALWTIILLGLICAFAINLVRAIQSFQENPTSTVVEIVNSPKFAVPPVMICPVNAIKESALRDKFPNTWKEQLKTVESVIAAARQVTAAASLTNLESFDSENDNYTIAEFEQMMDDVTYDPCELVVGLTFQGKELDCATNVTKILDREWGMCYRVDSGEDVKNTGMDQPLEIWFAIPAVPEILRKPHPTEPIARFLGPHMLVGLTVPREYLSRVIQPGAYTQVYVTWGHTGLISSNETRCLEKEDVLKLGYHFVKIGPTGSKAIDEYNRIRCADEVLSGLSLRACGCIPMGGSVMYTDWAMNLPVCNMHMIRGCQGRLLKDAETAQEPRNSCKILCSHWDQTIETTQVPMGKFAYNRRANNLTEGGNLSVISIQFGSMLIKKLTQTSAITFPSMVGTVGGILGLWLGASMFTLIQLGSYFLSLTTRAVRRGRKKTAVKCRKKETTVK